MSRRGARDIPPPLELECLSVLWRMGETNVRTVQEALAASRPLAYTTVMTMLERLARKELVSRRKTGRHFVYAALVERDVVRGHAVSHLVDSLFDASPQQLLAFLTANPGPPPSAAPAADSGPNPEDDEPGDSDFDAVLL
jgi:BlaI family transcriptional regulator, penicillinase repressor